MLITECKATIVAVMQKIPNAIQSGATIKIAPSVPSAETKNIINKAIPSKICMACASLVNGHILAYAGPRVNPQDKKYFVNILQKIA